MTSNDDSDDKWWQAMTISDDKQWQMMTSDDKWWHILTSADITFPKADNDRLIFVASLNLSP